MISCQQRHRRKIHEEIDSSSGYWQLSLLTLLPPPTRSRQGKSSASVSSIQALLPVARSSWRRSGRRCASLAGSREKISPSSTGLPRKTERLPELAADLVRLKVDLIVVQGRAGVSGQERHHYHPHRDDERWGPCGCRFGCQSGAAGRQCHGALEFSARAKYQKAGGTQGRGPQARPSWTSAAAGTAA